jgi:hypothetical protein
MESSVESNLKLAQTSDLLKTEQLGLQQEVKQCRLLHNSPFNLNKSWQL